MVAPAVMALMLVRWQPGALGFGLSRLVLGTSGLRRVRGLRFARVLGSGRDGGFGVLPGFDHQGLVGFFDDDAAAMAFVSDSPVAQAYREHAGEQLSAVMRASASRGSWGGVELAATASAQPGRPLAALTRASIRVRHARRFWSQSPATESSLRQSPGCRLAVGLGEAPLLRQATFSLWDDLDAMDGYARQGAHQRAAQGAWREGWFSESMFLRLVPLHLQGRWHGQVFG